MADQEGPDEVGSLGEETAKLLGALSGWAKEHGEAADQVVSGAASAWHRLDDHIATGGEDCRYCPLCQVIGFVRSTSPEVREHLSAAAGSLVQAASSMLATHPPTPDERSQGASGPARTGTGSARASRTPVEHIDLEEEPENGPPSGPGDEPGGDPGDNTGYDGSADADGAGT